jgi:hypothetical protein
MRNDQFNKFKAYIHGKYDSVAIISNDGEMPAVFHDRVIYDLDHATNLIKYSFVSGVKEWKPKVEKKPEEAPKCPYKEIIESLSEYPDKFTKALKAFRDELTKD